MSRLLLWIILFCFTLITAPLSSQEDTLTPTITLAEGWSFAEACIGEPSANLENWTFEGVLFFRSSRGIRALRADQPTTYFVAFEHPNLTQAGAISPDGKWFAVPSGRINTTSSMITASLVIDEIRIYATDPRNELMNVIEWNYRELIGVADSVFPSVIWSSSHDIVYPHQVETRHEVFIADIYSGEKELFTGVLSEGVGAPLQEILEIRRPAEGDTGLLEVQYASADGEKFDLFTQQVTQTSPAYHVSAHWFNDEVRFFLAFYHATTGAAYRHYVVDTLQRTFTPLCLFQSGAIYWSFDNQYFLWDDPQYYNDKKYMFDTTSNTMTLLPYRNLGLFMGWYPSEGE